MFLRRKKMYCISIMLTIILISISLIQSFAVTAGSTSSVSSQAGEIVAVTDYSSPSYSPTQTPTPNQYSAGAYYMDCYIAPDLSSKEPSVFQDFQIELSYNKALVSQGKTNENGYLKLDCNDIIHKNVLISKPGFLTRQINIKGDLNLGSANEPLLMWAGDINQDMAINMKDIVDISKSFNTALGDPKYNATADFNADKAINMKDILIAGNHFNCTSADYMPTELVKNVSVCVNVTGSEYFNITGGGQVDISLSPNEPALCHLNKITSTILTFPQGTQVTFYTSVWGNAEFSYKINDEGESGNKSHLMLTIMGGETITFFINAKDTAFTPTPTPTPTNSGYPVFHRMPYDVSTNMVADSITKDSANISADMVVNNYAAVSRYGTLVYWKKNNPEDKISIDKIDMVNDPKSTTSTTFCSLSSQITGLDADTTYCYQLSTYISPNGEMETALFEYYWTYGAAEKYNSDVYEFKTLPQ